ncbi:cytochrome c oxidase subunit 3 [Haloarchaeobius sp. DFWS5]|uniref:cytochrome c oxidase subunit 3 n=1 Tax=Haloarchaeobius sp. DFWS5 TaxID=3446114 RepID=UPI003EB86908
MTVAEDSSDDHGHHLPAVEDWPKGFGEASWWPFITAIGGGGIYLAVALGVLAQRGTVGYGAFAALAIGSVGAFLVGLFGWLYHTFVSTFWERSINHKSEDKLLWGMVAFLGSELATFGAGFIYYFFVRTQGFGELPHLVAPLVIVNTVLLILSSFTMHFAHIALLNNNRKRFLGLLGTTLALGTIFIGGQVYEYYKFIEQEGFTLGAEAFSQTFASGFYALTGLHGLHVSLGAVLLGIVFIRGLRGQYSAERHVSVSTVSMYWHFVDAVWIFLVVVLYVGAGAH